jgi:hypothetical protein
MDFRLQHFLNEWLEKHLGNGTTTASRPAGQGFGCETDPTAAQVITSRKEF